MPKLYTYTIYKTDGSKEVLPPRKKLDFSGPDGLYKLVGCSTIELVPKVYYGNGMNKRATGFCDENGLMAEKRFNPWFKVITDMFGRASTIVGDAVLEEVYHGKDIKE